VEGGGKLAFLETFDRPPSAQRAATLLGRQLSLLGATLLLVLVAIHSGLRFPAATGTALVAIVGALLIESFVAQALAGWNPRTMLRLVAPLVRVAHALLYPFLHPLLAVVRRIDGAASGANGVRDEDQEEEVEALIEVGEREGLLEAEEGEMMRGIVDLDETLVREIMRPRTDIRGLSVEATVAEARRELIVAGHSRMPVYRGSIDDVVGILHSRDLIQAWENGQNDHPIVRFLRPAVFVPETLSAADLLSEMRQKTQVALVVDEYGGIAGLVTLEDVLEEIVGDIRDEHDDEEERFVEQADGSWIVAAFAHVEDLEELLDVKFGDRDFDTVGGLVVSRLGRVPGVGETLEAAGLAIEVLRADRRRVQRVMVRRVADRDGQTPE
jgi:CBS domain containing-hemolysin-like protein